MDDIVENPEPNPGESQSDFVGRCIPYVKKEHPEWPQDQVVAVCYSIYRRKHNHEEMLKNGYQIFTDSAQLITIEHTETKENSEPVKSSAKRIVAMYGDRFMNGGFFPKEELKRVYKQWEGTLHDINHEGTSSGVFGNRQDITKFIGYHSNVIYDETNNSVSMDLMPVEETAGYEAWKGFITLCEKAGQIPNVSVTYYGKQKSINASELPQEVMENEGLSPNDKVTVLYNIVPVCVSTVLIGRCSDKGGCGIRNTESTCGSNSESCDCEKPKDTKLDEEIEKKRQELISWLKENS